MLMSGKAAANITASDIPVIVNVPVARRYARIDFSLRRSGSMDRNKKVVVKSVTFQNQRRQGHLFTPGTESTGADVSIADDFTDIALGAGSTAYTPIDRFYTMPRTDAAKAACLQLEVQIGDYEVYKLDAFINSGAVGGTDNDENLPVNLLANTIYKVNCTLNDRQPIEVEMSIVPWVEEDVDGSLQTTDLDVNRTIVPVAVTFPGEVRVTTNQPKIHVDWSAAPEYMLSGYESGITAVDIATPEGTADLTFVFSGNGTPGDRTVSVSAGNLTQQIRLFKEEGVFELEFMSLYVTENPYGDIRGKVMPWYVSNTPYNEGSSGYRTDALLLARVKSKADVIIGVTPMAEVEGRMLNWGIFETFSRYDGTNETRDIRVQGGMRNTLYSDSGGSIDSRMTYEILIGLGNWSGEIQTHYLYKFFVYVDNDKGVDHK